jgi:hypothetical protein
MDFILTGEIMGKAMFFIPDNIEEMLKMYGNRNFMIDNSLILLHISQMIEYIG